MVPCFGMRPRAIIFDCDGTLVDSEPLGLEVLVEVAAEYGAGMAGAVALEKLRGLPLADCIVEIERHCGTTFPPEFVGRVRQRTAESFQKRLQPMPGAAELLASLRIPFCVASSGPRDKIELSLTVTGLRPYFGAWVFSSHDVGTWKPHPGLFLHSAAELGVEPETCAVVEDSQPGVDAGLAAGMFVYAYGSAPLRWSPTAPVRRVSSHRELRTLLDDVCE